MSESWFRTTAPTGTIPREGNGNGSQVFQGFNHRLRFRFVDTDRLLLKKWGQTVQLTGTIRRPGPLLDYCFVVSSLFLSRDTFPSILANLPAAAELLLRAEFLFCLFNILPRH